MATRRTSTTAKKAEVERRILFYRIDAGLNEDRTPRVVPIPRVLKKIDGLDFNEKGRYLTEEDGNAICAWVDPPSRRGHHIRLGRIRRSDFPSVELAGRLTPVAVPAGGGLAEQFHAVFFRDGIVGVEFNFYAPRASRIGDYLWRKTKPITPPFVLVPLLRHDVHDQLKQLREVSLLRLRIKASFVEQLRRADESLGAAFGAARAVSDAEDIEIVLRPRPRSKKSLGARIKEAILGASELEGLNESAENFVVVGRDAETEERKEIDVLSDNLIAIKRVKKVSVKGKEVDRDSAYAAIEEAYDELHNQLVEAAGLAR